ncbi:MAG: hypothetical protein ACI841_000948, partial [Planctomycetota bacterium]
ATQGVQLSAPQDVVAVRGGIDASIYTCLGQGDGSFAPQVLTAESAAAAQRVLSADLTGDLHDDLIVTHADGFSILVRSEDGSFEATHHYANGHVPHVVADFNNDGFQDVASSNSTGVYVYNGTSSATGRLLTPRMFAAGPSVRTMVAGDFNADGFEDLAVINSDEQSIHRASILFNTGLSDASFEAPLTFGIPEVPITPAAGKFNSDDYDDFALVAGPFGDRDLWLFRSQGDGSFAQSKAFESGFFGAADLAAVDFLNDDSVLDMVVVTTNGFGNPIRTVVRTNNGNGVFQTSQEWADQGIVRTCDLNEDGIRDLVRPSDLVGQSLATHIGNGDGTFLARTEHALGLFDVSELVVATRSQLDRDVALLAIVAPEPDGSILLEDADLIPRVSVLNRGLLQATFDVQLKIGFDYDESIEVNLTSGQSLDIDFPAWSAQQIGTVPMQARTLLVSDQLALNDRQQTLFSVISSKTAPVVASASPESGGNLGIVTCVVRGANFDEDAKVRLTRSGEDDRIGDSTLVESGGLLKTIFDLRGAAAGPWEVMVENPDSEFGARLDGFEVENGGATSVWVDVMGRSTVRTGLEEVFDIVYGNSGNIDAPGGLLILSFPPSATIVPELEHSMIPLPAGADPAEVPASVFVTDDASYLPVQLLGLPAGSMASFSVRVTANAGSDFDIEGTLLHHGSGTTTTAASWMQSPARACSAESEIDEVDEAGLEEAVQIARNEAYRVGLAQFNPFQDEDRGLCIGSAFRLGTHLVNAPCEGDGELEGWRVRTVTAGTCHTGTIITSPNTGRHWYVDNYLFFGDLSLDLAGGSYPLVEMCNAGSQSNPRWSPVLDQAWKFWFMTLLCHEFAWPSDVEFLPSSINHPDWSYIDRVVTCGEDPIEVELPEADGFECVQGDLVCVFPVDTLGSFDPNEKVGVAGAEHATEGGGPAEATRFVLPGAPLPYAIFFENDPETATTAAQHVLITDQLDLTSLDLATFELGSIRFGDHVITPPAGLREFTSDVDLRPDIDLVLRVTASLDIITGEASWYFQSLDPVTLEITTNPVIGFLPPNLFPPEGEGRIDFRVEMHAGFETGREILNTAEIIFDVTPAIVTPTWRNTIDSDFPTSEVESLERVGSTSDIRVRWSGEDNGAGIADYSLFVSIDGGEFEPWITWTQDSSAVYKGGAGKTYSFQSVARDRVGHAEELLSTTSTPSISIPTDEADGGPGGGGGSSTCFIATAAYGGGYTHEVASFRAFRDSWLLTNAPGRFAVRAYERLSPPLANYIRDRAWARSLTRCLLFPFLLGVCNPVLLTLVLTLALYGLWRKRTRRIATDGLALT